MPVRGPIEAIDARCCSWQVITFEQLSSCVDNVDHAAVTDSERAWVWLGPPPIEANICKNGCAQQIG